MIVISAPPDPDSLAAACARAAEALLAEGAGPGDSSVATRAEQAFERLQRQLARLVGEIGVRTVFKRSLSMASAQFPWLAVTAGEVPGDVSPGTALRIALSTAPPETARQAFAAVLTIFVGLLARLIGEPLVRRMLQEVWPAVFRAQKESL